jgi:hypothetical protein
VAKPRGVVTDTLILRNLMRKLSSCETNGANRLLFTAALQGRKRDQKPPTLCPATWKLGSCVAVATLETTHRHIDRQEKLSSSVGFHLIPFVRIANTKPGPNLELESSVHSMWTARNSIDREERAQSIQNH